MFQFLPRLLSYNIDVVLLFLTYYAQYYAHEKTYIILYQVSMITISHLKII